MLVEKDLKLLFKKLFQDETAHFTVGGSDILIRIFDHASKLSLSTQVYFGGNFIPKSVRACVEQQSSSQSPFSKSNMSTYLKIDENNFQVILNYLGKFDHLHSEYFKMLLEEFSWLADEWRFYLDEHDKQDLVHLRKK